MARHEVSEFLPLSIALLTISNSRGEEEDTSGHYLAKVAKEAGHHIFIKKIVKENIYQIRAICSNWIADASINVILINGGTGFSTKNITPEAISVLFDREIEGFGELFRMFSYEEIGTSTLQSRALAGIANQTILFAIPGSTSACRTAWQKIICEQLDSRYQPCNFTSHLKMNTCN